MITEDYVSFETAKLLKEKGFDIYVSSFYDVDGKFNRKEADWNWNIGPRYSAPTLQMTMKWLRKAHEIFIRPNTNFLYPIRYYYEIFCYGNNLKTQQDVTTENFESPEEACESAIKYCLEKLI